MAKIRTPRVRQPAVYVLTFTVVLVVVVSCLYWAQAIFIPLALALFLTFLLAPLVTALQRRGLGRAPAVLLTLALALLVLAGTGWLVFAQLNPLVDRLGEYGTTIQAKVRPLSSWVEGVNQKVNGLLSGVAPAEGEIVAPLITPRVVVKPESTPWVNRLPTFLMPAAHLLGGAALALVLTGFMLFKREDLRNRFLRLAGRGQVAIPTLALDEAASRISRFLRMQALISAIAGASIGLGLLVLGVEYALLWGLLVFLLRYVPYVGIWFAAVPPVLISFATSDGWTQPLLAAGWIFVVEMLCGNVLEPWLYGQSIGVSEVSLLVAAAFWAFLWGPIGMVLSSPLTVCLVVLGRYHPRLRFLGVLLGDEPPLEPRLQFYQRLLARDQDEASEIVQAQLKGDMPPLKLFDELLVPALVAARRDVEAEDLPEEAEVFVLEATREIGEELAHGLVPFHGRLAQGLKAGEAPARARLLACPAADSQDEAALHLLAATLDPARWEVCVVPAGEVYSALLNWGDDAPPDLIVVGVLPPGGLAHTRYLCRRLRGRFPDTEVLVARLGQEVSAEGRKGITEAGATEIAITFEEAREHVLARRPADSVGEARRPAVTAAGNGKGR